MTQESEPDGEPLDEQLADFFEAAIEAEQELSLIHI